MKHLVRLGVGTLAVVMMMVCVMYFFAQDQMLALLGGSIKLYAGVMMIGIASFGWAAVRILWIRLESWYALLEAAIISGIVAYLVISTYGTNTLDSVIGICALWVGILCVILRLR